MLVRLEPRIEDIRVWATVHCQRTACISPRGPMSGERAVGRRLPEDCSATLRGLLASIGIDGWFASESVAGMDRNHWPLCSGFRKFGRRHGCHRHDACWRLAARSQALEIMGESGTSQSGR